MASVLDRLGNVVRGNGWIVASVVVAVALAAVVLRSPIAMVVFGVYATLNSLGVQYYCERLRRRRPRLQLAVRVLAVVLVPVGPVTAVLHPPRVTPSEAASIGSDDEGVRRASAAAGFRSHYGGGGAPWG